MVNTLIDLFKVRIGLMMALTAMVAMFAMPGHDWAGWEMAVLGLSVLVAAASAGAFNQYYEADLDGRMRRTRNRPFVTGVFRKGPVWLVLIAALLVASVAAAAVLLNAATAVYIFLGALFYGVVYTVWLKRRTWLNIVVGGASGSFAVLAGAAAVAPNVGPVPIQLAVVLFFWTPSHFWSLAIAKDEDYAGAGVPMLPAVAGKHTAAKVVLINTLVLVAVSVLPYFYGLGWIYLLGALGGGIYFIFHNVRMVRDPSPKVAIKSFLASLVHLCALLVGIVLDALLLA